MKTLLEKYVGSEIGVNIEHPTQIDTVGLVAVHADFFTVNLSSNGNTYHVPFGNISKIIEHPDGVTVGGIFHPRRTYTVVIQIGHVVESLPS